MTKTALPTSNYTMLPNVLFDELLPLMGNAEMRVVLAMCRKIFGFHKTAPEPISVTLLQTLTGMSRQGVMNGLNAAVERGVVVVAEHGPRASHLYTLNLVDYAQLVNEVDQSTALTSSGPQTRPDLVNEVDTQKKGKETSKEQEIPSDPPTPPAEGQPETLAAKAGAAQEPAAQEQPSPESDRWRAMQEEVVAELFKGNWAQAGRAGKLAHMFLGQAAAEHGDKYAEFNVTPPLVPGELRDWKAWYLRTQLDRNGKPLDLPQRLESLNQSVFEFRSQHRRGVERPTYTPLSDEELAAARAEQLSYSEAARAAFARKAAGHAS